MEKGVKTYQDNPKNVTDFSKAFLMLVVALFFFAALFIFLDRLGDKYSREDDQAGFPEEGQDGKEPVQLPKVIYNLSGEVESVSANSIIINAVVFRVINKEEITRVTERRTAFIDPETRITILRFVSQPGTDKKMPQETPTTLAEISIGDSVEVISSQNINEADEFTATHVRILP